VGDHGPVHLDVVIITKILEIFPDELGTIIGDDGFRDPEIENDVLDEIYYPLGANLS
jgi:phosphatidate phosphatase APP1